MGRRKGGGRKRTFRREDTAPKHRINDMIRTPEVRLVGDNVMDIAKELGLDIGPGQVHDTRRAKQWARDVDLDLVEISPNAEPPVAKIIDYKKFLYQQKQREKELKANTVKTVVKEVRFGPNTDDHDFEFKTRHARNFLEDGAKVKAYVHFRGRSIVFKDRGELLLLRFMKELEDLGVAEAMPKMEKRRMNVMIAPKKRPSKKNEKKNDAPLSKKAKKAQSAAELAEAEEVEKRLMSTGEEE
ncbi:translation initiation factor IF-3 [Neolewinella persica]|uniref:translation initiation factor IF-3 n=1 Tax=Neolewinella persica TaxID=70998 RepID=UPI00036DC7E9|nr:translation initiation factor IF-3 [Neolewinella persica]